jgi:hypothetical protein
MIVDQKFNTSIPNLVTGHFASTVINESFIMALTRSSYSWSVNSNKVNRPTRRHSRVLVKW